MVTETVKEMESQEISIVSQPTFELAPLPARGRSLLLQMFTDPYLLQKEDRADLVRSLRECVASNPQVSDLRVVLGMALCVNFEVEAAIDELQEGVCLAPQSFIANLKMGELWMRLRVCTKAEEYTRQAALLADNHVQSEMARKQAATIRGLMHEGIQRGILPFKMPRHIVAFFRKLLKRDQTQNGGLVAVESE